jgi:hypothetical protein
VGGNALKPPLPRQEQLKPLFHQSGVNYAIPLRQLAFCQHPDQQVAITLVEAVVLVFL